jgi:hypothetical protein
MSSTYPWFSTADVRADQLDIVPMSPPKTATLVGREHEINRLHEHFGNPQTGLKAVLLSGLEGIRMTQLALHYVEQNISQYQLIFGFDLLCTQIL